MWFKNLRIYRLDEDFAYEATRFEAALADFAFQPCGQLDSRRLGWTPPLGGDGAPLSHSAAGSVMIVAREQEKLLPAAVLREQLDEQVREIEAREKRELGRRERRRLKDELLHTLLPRALTRSRRNHAFLAPQAYCLFVDSATSRRAEDLLNLLRDSLGSLPVRPLQPRQDPIELMTRWLAAGKPPPGFTFGGDCLLRDPLDANNVVRCRGQDLASAEVRIHLEAGKRVAMLGLNWSGRVSFQLNEDYVLRSLRFSELVAEQAKLDEADEAAQFDSEFAIMSGELLGLLEALTDVFGEAEAG